VTELEVRHGFLDNPHLPAGHCFFFFRDPSYLDQLNDDAKKRFEGDIIWELRKQQF
jgi:hypothetical protein